MVRSSEIDDCTMLFMFTSARKRNCQRNFSFITKGTELSPRFRVFLEVHDHCKKVQSVQIPCTTCVIERENAHHVVQSQHGTMVSAKSSSVSNFPLYANSRNLAIKYLFGHFLSVIILWSPFGGWKRIWFIVYGNIIPNSRYQLKNNCLERLLLLRILTYILYKCSQQTAIYRYHIQLFRSIAHHA